MTGTRNSRSPNQWQEGPPGWRFDGWGVARGGRNHDPEMALRATGAERVTIIVGWSVVGVLVLLAGLTNDTLLGLFSIFVAIVMAALRWVMRHRRARYGSGETR